MAPDYQLAIDINLQKSPILIFIKIKMKNKREFALLANPRLFYYFDIKLTISFDT